MRMRLNYFGILVCLLTALGAHAAVPSVSNVNMAQRIDGSGLVDITYDVSDADADSVAVSVHFSVDGGIQWDFPALNLTGDVGKNIPVGINKAIVWNAGMIPELPILANIQVKVLANDFGVEFFPHSPNVVSITDFSQVDWSDEANFDLYARADFIQLMGSVLWQGGSAENIPVISELKSRNPDLKVVAYVSVKSAQLSAVSPTADEFWQQWLLRTQPYWVATTTGDTASDFPGNVLINILDPDCRSVMIETIQEFQNNSLNKFDGVYWDYFNTSIWVHGDVEATGEPDFDGDGIAQKDDPDERIAFRAAQVSLVEALRDSLGDGFIQVFNGQRAYSDSTFAALGDGAMYELFPTLFFAPPNMQNALDPNNPFGLFQARDWYRTANGGPYVVLANTWQNWFVDTNNQAHQLVNGNQYRAVAMLADLYASWNTSDLNPYSNSYAWTDNDISLGAPLGPTTFEGNFLRREFQYGKVEIEMTSGSYPDPFDYRIWALGQLVEELRVPFHFP
ncbi:MAG: hypothetical protein ACI9UK_000316 [Candidatus Krumholzibacteriia bacterium]